jgi:hypothetical protein
LTSITVEEVLGEVRAVLGYFFAKNWNGGMVIFAGDFAKNDS